MPPEENKKKGRIPRTCHKLVAESTPRGGLGLVKNPRELGERKLPPAGSVKSHWGRVLLTLWGAVRKSRKRRRAAEL